MNPVEYASGIDGWMRQIELEWLSRKAASLKPGSTWLEVGTWMGRSWSCVALSLPAASKILAVDDFNGGYGETAKFAKENWPLMLAFIRTHEDVRSQRPDLISAVIAAPSVRAACLVPDASCDAIFIDGDHRAEFVRDDLQVWRPKLKAGGLMCGHDISDPGVVTALRGYPYKFDPNGSGSIWWIV